MSEFYHKSILSHEIKDLAPTKGILVDVTLGGGGHSKMLFDNLSDGGLLISFDRDEDAINYCVQNYGHKKTGSFYILEDKNTNVEYPNIENKGENKDKTWIIAKSTFSNLKDSLDTFLEGKKVDFLLADIGVSSFQIDQKKRGFTFQQNGPLDMRMDKNQELSAKDLVNGLSQRELEKVFREYGEEKYSQPIAWAIVNARSKKMLKTTFDIVEIINKSVGDKYEASKNPARRVFQALRIAVNNEFFELEELCHNLPLIMHKSGQVVILTFHSLERNILENRFTNFSKILPNDIEMKSNPRSKSTVGYLIKNLN